MNEQQMFDKVCKGQFQEIKSSISTVFDKLDDINKAISGNGNSGIKNRIDVAEVKIENLDKNILEIREEGSPSTQKKIATIESDVRLINDKVKNVSAKENVLFANIVKVIAFILSILAAMWINDWLRARAIMDMNEKFINNLHQETRQIQSNSTKITVPPN